MHGYSISSYSILVHYIYTRYIEPIHRFFSVVWSFLGRPGISLGTGPVVPAPIVVSPTDAYVEKQTARFLKTYSESLLSVEESTFSGPRREETEERLVGKCIDYNSAIDPVFYSRKELTELLKDEDNVLEPKWRAKILFESTPRGNIIMHYDAFKQGFAYYADQTGIPYSILNAVAMKYVRFFRCRDFFIDEHVLPENAPSGITTRHATYDREEKEKKRALRTETEKEKGGGVNVASNSAFAKFKSYNSVSAKANGYTPKSSENVASKSKEEQTAAPKLTNKHISLGKTSNFSFLQKPVRKRLPTVESALLPKPRLSYAEYKRLSGEILM